MNSSTVELFARPHRRYNRLTGEWVLVSPHRTKRPWKGQVEKTPEETRPAYDANCYLCPGNARAGGRVIRNIPVRSFLPMISPRCCRMSVLEITRWV